MKTFAITAPGETRLFEKSPPEPAPNDVLLRIHIVGCCGSDLNTFRGLNPMVTYPRVPGHEIAATIEETGTNVPDEWHLGMQVTVSPYTSCGHCNSCRSGRFNCCRYNETLGVQRDGAMTEYLTVPWQKLFHSDKLSLKELALVEPLTVGSHAVDRGDITNGDKVMVLGCGTIGLGTIAAAAMRGAEVLGVDIDDTKLDLAQQAGAAATVNSASEDVHEWLQLWTDDEGPQAVIEAIGLPQTFRAAVEEVAFAGRVVYLGYAKAPVQYETKLFVQKELNICGSRNATPTDFKSVISMLEAKKFPIDAVVTKKYSLDDAAQAFQAWDAAPAAYTKILVQISKE
ncbi:MAG: zinc-binding alcohol dehydrogenase family protein [Candidatus Pacebacteria bacterium]|nr:zinc-binding alcohol dehydrogenase family protein [Candidatus Paceibacterota bacterium]